VILPRESDDAPAFLIVAGPNGSGKSSVYQNADMEWDGLSVWIINPDLLTVRIRDIEGLDLDSANLAAIQRMERWLEASLDVHQSIGVETVLSTSKYRRLVEKAHGLGFAVWLIYVLLDSPERNVERVRLRVKKGGHSVPEEKIRARYARSLEQLHWFLDQADRAWVFDNSGAEPDLIAEKLDGTVALAQNALSTIVDIVRTIQTD
jgi:predicted ABC-type ATPase